MSSTVQPGAVAVEPVRHVPTLPFDPAVETYTQFAGFYEPYEYSGWVDESMSWKRTCYVGDWSGLGKLLVTGPDALRFFSDIAVNGFARFDIGQAKHAVMCNDDGKVTGEGVLMRWAEDQYYFTSGPGAVWARFMFDRGDYDATCEVVTDRYTIQQVQGPSSLALMEELAGESLRDIGFMRFREVQLDGRRALVLRQGMAGEVGYEIHGAWEEGAAMVARILEIGEKHGIRRLGGRTKMVNHVEACFPTPGVDYIPAWFDIAESAALESFAPPRMWERLQRRSGSASARLQDLCFSPVELGWSRNIDLDHGFVGAQALRRERESPDRTMRTLIWNAEDVGDVLTSFLRGGEVPYDFMEWPRGLLGCVEASEVHAGGAQVGVATSRCYSYFFRAMISLAVIDSSVAEPGTEVEVVWGAPGGRQKTIRAEVAPAPLKRDNRRVDVNALGTTSGIARGR